MSRNSVNKRSVASVSEPIMMNRILQQSCVGGGPLRTKGKELKATKPEVHQMVSDSTSLDVEFDDYSIETYERNTKGVPYHLQRLLEIESSIEIYNNSPMSEYSRGSLSTTEGESCTPEVVRQLAPESTSKPSDWKPLIKRQRVRGVCFTLNNYTDRDQQELRDQYDAGLYTYLVFGREVGKLGTPHLQGYAHFTKQQSFEQIKKIFGRRYHFEYARATGAKFAERYLYCMKDGDFEEFGDRPVHGKEKTKPKIMDLIQEGKNQTELRQILPEGYFHHSAKIENWFEEERKINPPKIQTKYYLIEQDKDVNVYEAISKLFPNEEFAHIFNLSELISYRNNDGVVKNICYHNPENVDQVESWSYGAKILCKNGYKQLPIYCERMIVYVPWYGLTKNKLTKYQRLENLHEDFMLVPLEEKRVIEGPLSCKQLDGPPQRG